MNKKLAVVKAPSNVVPMTPHANPENHISAELAKYSGIDIYELVEPAKNYLVYKLFLQSQSDDPMASLNAISLLAKIFQLFTEKVEVSYSGKSKTDLESELQILMRKAGLA